MEDQEINKITMWAMIAVALFFDGIQFGADLMNFIPYVGFILAWTITSGVSIFAWLTFSCGLDWWDQNLIPKSSLPR